MKRILVVDDEAIIRKVALNTLRSENFEILEAADGEEALHLVEEKSPHLVLLDLKMPGLSGIEVCRKIKSDPATRSTFVVMLSGQADEEDVRKGEEAGADDYFTKPFSPLELMTKVNSLLGEDMSMESKSEKPVTFGGQYLRREDEIEHLERNQLVLYARDLNRVFQEELQKSQELRRTNERLREAEKMKDVFISLVSHELRTPLSIIKGYVMLMDEALRSREVGGELSEFMKAIRAASERLEGLIRELLDFSKMKAGLVTFDKKELNLPALLQLIHRELLPQARKCDQEFTIEVKTEVHTIRGDGEKLKEAFAHIIRNALSFTPKGGKVWVEYYDEGAAATVKICDTGIGIPSSELDKVFSPFFQVAEVLTRTVDGMGLGLSIAKHIIEDHGGTITVTSVENEGTCFTVSLQRSQQDAIQLVSDPRQVRSVSIEEMGKHLDQAEGQLLVYARDMSELYSEERLKSQMLEETLEELENTYFQTIASLARIVDVKDAYLGEHTDRVTYYANVIAKHLNPELVREKDFKYSLLLHDIGKIGLAEELLQKAGKLTEEEFSILRTHPELGMKILEPIKFLTPALASVRSHHERWDGKGYPDGLRGDEIPLPARIIAVADAFDAMTTDRPYRKGMSFEVAKQEISRQGGTQFDPEIVEAFLKSWEEIVAYTAGRRDLAL